MKSFSRLTLILIAISISTALTGCSGSDQSVEVPETTTPLPTSDPVPVNSAIRAPGNDAANGG